MKSVHLLPIFVLSTLAVTVRNYAAFDCGRYVADSDYSECTNLPMLSCCERNMQHSGSQYFHSSRFSGLNSLSAGGVAMENYALPWPFGGRCGKHHALGFGNDAGQDTCVNGPRDDFLTGSRWLGLARDPNAMTDKNFADLGVKAVSKRDAEEARSAAGDCTPVKPNKVVFKNGHMFNTGPETPEEDAELIFGLFVARAEMEDIPEHLLKHEIEQEGVVFRRGY